MVTDTPRRLDSRLRDTRDHLRLSIKRVMTHVAQHGTSFAQRAIAVKGLSLSGEKRNMYIAESCKCPVK
ncbi:hypothetical protein PPGU19_063460 (plasmid) [Paraburkholderia sp. PGU19]|nr:hypothetical protein PPGU19_063460 [Paraburkholderia sp. PGU19]